MLATTAYDSPDASYTFSIARSREALTAAGFQSAYMLLQGNCHVDDARNAVVRDFLTSDCTDLVFLDADVSWEPDRLVTLCGYKVDIVGGVYPYRRESEKESMPVRVMGGPIEPDENGLLEVEGLPTGFMKIRRHVLEEFSKTVAHFRNDDENLTPLVFERGILGGGRWGGDIRFCMRWRERGGKVYAAANLRLGHCGKHVLNDSLAASLRRQAGVTLPYIVKAIRERKATLDTYAEAARAMKNGWGASPDVLQIATSLARSADGPILEIGSGLSTVLMAAANPGQMVWCIEHDPVYAAKLPGMLEGTEIRNITLVTAPLVDGWYDPSDDIAELPEQFALAFVDGPPRALGDRMRFFDVFGDKCKTILCDDANDRVYAGRLTEWAKSQHRDIKIDGRAAVILSAFDTRLLEGHP